MSDNNLNNQNQQPGYENFNQYQQPAQPVYVAAPGVVMNNNGDEAKAKTLGIWALVMAILSCCCGITSFVGLGLAITGLKKNKNSTICIIALILNILAVVAIIYNAVNYAMHPELLQQQMEQYQQLMQQMEQTAQQAGFIR